jgi:hypothetical protein
LRVFFYAPSRAMTLQLDRIESKLDELLQLIRPVHAHASWVDALRVRLAQLRLMPSLVTHGSSPPSPPPPSPEAQEEPAVGRLGWW